MQRKRFASNQRPRREKKEQWRNRTAVCFYFVLFDLYSSGYIESRPTQNQTKRNQPNKIRRNDNVPFVFFLKRSNMTHVIWKPGCLESFLCTLGVHKKSSELKS